MNQQCKMYNFWCITTVFTIMSMILVPDIVARPQKIVFGNYSGDLENGNKSKLRILTHPSKLVVGQEQEIVFPDDSTEDIADAKCDGNLPFCEEAVSYPYNHLKTVLAQNPMLKVLFGQDEAPKEIANRIGDDYDAFICHSISRTIFPKMGKNKNDKWKFIVNQDDDGFIQGVQIEECRNPEGECDLPTILPVGYETSCKQKYVYRRLISVSNDGQPVPDTFKLPSACCCAYKRNFDFLARFGKDLTPVPKNKNNKN